MKVVDLTINGKKCGLFFNLTAYIDICKHFGGLDEMFSALDDEKNALENFLWLAASLIKGAHANAKVNGGELALIDFDELAASVTPYEFIEIRNKVLEAMSGKTEIEIKVNDPKNAEATEGTI